MRPEADEKYHDVFQYIDTGVRAGKIGAGNVAQLKTMVADGVERIEKNRAAVKLQSFYRGHYLRNTGVELSFRPADLAEQDQMLKEQQRLAALEGLQAIEINEELQQGDLEHDTANLFSHSPRDDIVQTSSPRKRVAGVFPDIRDRAESFVRKVEEERAKIPRYIEATSCSSASQHPNRDEIRAKHLEGKKTSDSVATSLPKIDGPGRFFS